MLRNRKQGFGGVASTMIMFIAIISVTTGLVIAFQNYFVTTQSSLQYQQNIANEQLRTIMSITNVYYDSIGKSLSIYVKNIGSTDLVTNSMDVFVDGIYNSSVIVYYADDDTKVAKVLVPQDTGLIKLDLDLSVGSHKARIVSEYGVGITDTFNVE